MKIAFLVGRIVVGLFYLFSGVNLLLQLGAMVAFVGSRNVPFPEVAVPVSAILLLIAGLSILTGIWPVIGVVALVVFLLPVSVIIHNFWAVADPMQRAEEMYSFLLNMGLLGSGLMFLAIPRPWPYSLKFPGRTPA